MITRIVLPLFGLLGIYHTTCTLTSIIHNKFLPIPCIVLVIFLQIAFVDEILPFNTHYNTQYFIFQYVYFLWKTFFSTYLTLMLSFFYTNKNASNTISTISSTKTNTFFQKGVIPYIYKNFFQYTNPLQFETEPHSIQNKPILREHVDSYLYYFRYKTMDITNSQTLFQITFNLVFNIN